MVRVVGAVGKTQFPQNQEAFCQNLLVVSECSPMSKPLTPDMSPIIHPIKDIQKDPMDDAIEQSIDKVRNWCIGLMLHSTIIYHIQFGKQKLGEDEEVELVNQIDASFPSPGCPASVSNVAPHCKYALTEGKDNVAPVSSKREVNKGQKVTSSKHPTKIGKTVQVEWKRKLLNLRGSTYKTQVQCS